MEVIQIKPRNPSNTSTACVLDVLERQFEIEVSKTTQDGDCYIAEVKGIGSFEKIQKELPEKSLRLRKWEFKLVTFHHESAKSHEVFSAQDPSTSNECILVNITYSDPDAFIGGKVPDDTVLKKKFINIAATATCNKSILNMSDYNYAFTFTKVDFCSLYVHQASSTGITHTSAQNDDLSWKSLLIKVEVECPPSYSQLDGKTFYYEFLSDIVSKDCWICWKCTCNKDTKDGFVLDLNLKREEK